MRLVQLFSIKLCRCCLITVNNGTTETTSAPETSTAPKLQNHIWNIWQVHLDMEQLQIYPQDVKFNIEHYGTEKASFLSFKCYLYPQLNSILK